MKQATLLTLALIPFLLLAQDDDYCYCMETDNSYTDLFTNLTNYKEELGLWQKQTTTTTITKTWKVSPPKQAAPPVLVVEAFLEEQEDLKEKAIPVTQAEDDLLEDSRNEAEGSSDRTEKRSYSSGKQKIVNARIKRKVKRLKGKIKRKKKVRKYKGSCPNF